MRGHREVPKNPRVAVHTSRLLLHKHLVPVSPLECALTEPLTTAHSKRLTQRANSFRMRSYKKRWGEGAPPIRPSPPPLTRKETCRPSNLRPSAALFFTQSAAKAQIGTPLHWAYASSRVLRQPRLVAFWALSIFHFHFSIFRKAESCN